MSQCIVFGCKNRSNEGRFIDNICGPCYRTITSGEVGVGESFIHKLLKARQDANEVMVSAGLVLKKGLAQQ